MQAAVTGMATAGVVRVDRDERQQRECPQSRRPRRSAVGRAAAGAGRQIG